MASNDEAERRRRPSINVTILALLLIVTVILTAWVLVTVSKTNEISTSNFVTPPTTPLSKTGQSAKFVSISGIAQKGVFVGVKGFLQNSTGQPISGAQVYVQYYLRGQYRTQLTNTGQNGYFEINFPMNWTGWLPVTLTYFGDSQYQGLKAVFSVSGENL